MAAPPAPRSTPARRPNVVLILADDMGYSDIGCFGSEIRTPNLDALAAGGLSLTHMYNCARCCPSRAALLTGVFPHQAGIGDMTQDRGLPSYQGYLRSDCVTLAEALRPAGYFTAHTGKWHVGGLWGRGEKDRANWRFGDPKKPLPPDRGFDRFYGNPAGGGSYFNVMPLVDQDHIIEPPDGFYVTDQYTTEALRVMEEAVAADRPFFVHVCHNAPHWPLHAPAEDVARYRGKYRCGWDHIRAARHEELKGRGLLDARWPISPRDPNSVPWEDEPLQDWQDARMAVYAAQVDRMDQNIGRIVNRLRELNVLDDTLIIFVSDNGGSAESVGTNRQNAEAPFTRDGRPVRVGNIPGLEPGGPDTFMSYGLPWANASNSPFRLFKSFAHEGGISTPLIAHWPKGIRAGLVNHEPCHFVDITATILDVAGATYPKEFNGQAIQSLEGESFAALLQDRRWTRQRPMFWEHIGNAAVRHGRWKLVRRVGGPWELYDIVADRTELHNLAERYPDEAKALAREWQEWAARCGVWPWEKIKERDRQRLAKTD